MELNGNIIIPSGSAEDLSEYTDADESMSAPTEILAEFLSSLMAKDYESAFKYCKIILQYEPNHNTAKEFYPLLLEKITQGSVIENSSDTSSDEDDEESSAEEDENSPKSSEDSDATTASYSSLEDEEVPSTTLKIDNAFIHENNGNSLYTDSESPTTESTTSPTSEFSLISFQNFHI